jgi:hypothetical protein
MTEEEAEAALKAWATVQKEELVQAAYRAGVSKYRISAITGIARTTVDRILARPLGAPQERITDYLERFTRQWPRRDTAATVAFRPLPAMASAYNAAAIAEALLADADFRALRLGTWLSTPDGELVAAAVAALSPPPYDQDITLLIEALKLAAQRQHDEARQKLAAGFLGAAAIAIAVGASRGLAARHRTLDRGAPSPLNNFLRTGGSTARARGSPTGADPAPMA